MPREPSPWPAGVAALDGVEAVWAETRGDSCICVAILDGPVDVSHPALLGARLTQVEALAQVSPPGDDRARRHGTHVATVILGGHSGPVKGIAPGCRGVSIPVFESAKDSFQPCSQLDLARAISMAVQHGAHVINISGGEFSPSGTAYPLLENVVRECGRRGILIVAAAGNEGCECLHVPAALPGLLAVGAMDRQGNPLASSNWGRPYQDHGILAPGENIPGARAGGGVLLGTGTSYATAVVSGVVALLLSLQRVRGLEIDPSLVRAALLRSALGCDYQRVPDCQRLLAGRLNVRGAISLLQGNLTMSEMTAAPTLAPAASDQPAEAGAPPAAAPEPPGAEPSVSPSAVRPSACSCQGTGPLQLVYALGQLGYDLVSEARLDSLAQKLAAEAGGSAAQRVLAFDPRRLLTYLEQNPWDAAAVEWTLSLDGTPIYAIRPGGPFAADAYQLLRRFLREQLDEGVERISVPGVITGKVTLLMGQTVPVVVPEIRGMYSWTTAALLEAVAGPAPAAEASPQDRERHAAKKEGLKNFLDRVYHELRNLGMMPHDRALNFAATNAHSAEEVYESAMGQAMELESIQVARSPICRPGSDCWDVEVYFFYPERQVQTVRRVYRFTVDVSDIVPVTVGPMRSWFTR
jgi:hypothetical protein